MSIKKKSRVTLVSQAKSHVPGFTAAFSKFMEGVTIDQCSKGLISNYSHSIAVIALHFGKVPHHISVDEINSYLYRMTVHENLSVSYFKQAVYCPVLGLVRLANVLTPVKRVFICYLLHSKI